MNVRSALIERAGPCRGSCIASSRLLLQQQLASPRSQFIVIPVDYIGARRAAQHGVRGGEERVWQKGRMDCRASPFASRLGPPGERAPCEREQSKHLKGKASVETAPEKMPPHHGDARLSVRRSKPLDIRSINFCRTIYIYTVVTLLATS